MFFDTNSNIFRPQQKQVLIFGIITLPFIVAVVYYLRFIWLYQLMTLTPAIIIIILLTGVVLFYIDWKLKFKILRYFKISIAFFLIIIFISLPVCKILEVLSEKRAKKIIFKIEKFKKDKNEYPGLSEFYAFKGLPGRTLLGTHYRYNVDVVNGIEIYRLEFRSFNGNTAYYNQGTGKWLYTD